MSSTPLSFTILEWSEDISNYTPWSTDRRSDWASHDWVLAIQISADKVTVYPDAHWVSSRKRKWNIFYIDLYTHTNYWVETKLVLENNNWDKETLSLTFYWYD